jgi:cytochrome c oxidase subunit III
VAETLTEPIVENQFDDADQQHDAAILGMWSFLATEVLFFGGLFVSYAIYRERYPEAFALACHKLDVMLGAVNTAVLLGSSLTMALGVRAAQLGQRRQVVAYLVGTMLLGAGFLGIKAVEYHHDYVLRLVPWMNFSYPGDQARGVEMFFVLYFFMTGLHAIHLVIGIVLVGLMAVLVARGWFSGGGITQIEVTGLYWHFIDIVWVFLYPLLYLIDVHR